MPSRCPVLKYKTRFLRLKRISQWSGRTLVGVRIKCGTYEIMLRFEAWHGYHPAEVCRHIEGEVVVVREFPWRAEFMKKIKVGEPGAAGGAEQLASPETKMLSQFPCLVAHCSRTKYDDGSPRKPGWFTLKTLGSAWVMQVKDPDAGAQMQVTSQTLDDCLTMAELLVGSENAPWEPDAYLRATQKRAK